MAIERKQYLDYEGLREYDELIKGYINDKVPSEEVLAQLAELGELVSQVSDNTQAIEDLKTYIDGQDLAIYNAINAINNDSIENLFVSDSETKD